jgi:ABC-type glycerol-3-phosphate transport system substrate-binding protein
MKSKSMRFTAVGIAVLVAATGCGSSSKKAAPKGDLNGVHLDIYGTWSGQEQQKFQLVLDGFKAKTGASVTYTSTGDNMATVLGSKLAGGQPPDIAMVAQPGIIAEYAKKGYAKPLGSAGQAAVTANYSKVWSDLGTVDGKLYGVFFKAANKSTVWYRTAAFQQAGIQPPATWPDFIKACGVLDSAGITPVAIGGADGWTLTDWFENVYLSQAGADMYNKLAKHQIRWTDPTVKAALTTLAQLFSNNKYIVGGAAGALQTDFPTSVTDTFGDTPKSAITYEGDFVSTNITTATKAKVGTDAKYFNFPAAGKITGVTGGGDSAVILKDNKGAQELAAYLASPEAASIWVKQGGFTSPDKNVDASLYPDDTQRSIAKAVVDAGDNFVFDMSDQAPAAFGGTKGAGEWKDLQDFLKNTSTIDATMAQLESDAAKAYSS